MADIAVLSPDTPALTAGSAVAVARPAYREPASVRHRIETMERLLENLVRVPVINRRFGLDVILDIIPIGGSLIAAAMGAWIVWEARNLGVSRWTMAKMAGNVGLDFLFGQIPIVGFIPDFFFRSNTRNLKLLKGWLEKHHPVGAGI